MSSEVESSSHEPSVVSLRAVLLFVVIFVGFTAVSQVGLWWMYRALVLHAQRSDVERSALVSERPLPPDPRLQPSLGHDTLPRQDMAALRQREDAEFERRGWTRAANGEFTIPEEIVTKISALSATQPEGGAR